MVIGYLLFQRKFKTEIDRYSGSKDFEVPKYSVCPLLKPSGSFNWLWGEINHMLFELYKEAQTHTYLNCQGRSTLTQSPGSALYTCH